MNLKGTLPTLILEVLSRGPSHGYEIAQTIKRRSEGVLDFKEGTLYPALHSLEADGLIEAEEVIEGGRTRRSYRLTRKGKRSLEAGRAKWQRVSNAINTVLEGTS